ncbi:MAG: hypothetical protein ABL993_06560 [Vicinamibacterales bacterium]
MNDPADLERRVDHALHGLETPRAPLTLLPRVMAAVHARTSLPWYRREWRLWPLGWQLASGVASAVLLVLALSRWPSLELTPGLLRNTGALDGATELTNRVDLALAAVQVLWRVVVEPVVPVLFALTMLTCAACMALGLTLNYIALGRTWQR